MTTYSGTPKTWSVGEVVTAAMLNAEVRDPILALAGASNAYTPTLGGGWTVGNGTISGAYVQVGKLVAFRALMVFGSTSAAVSAYPTLSLPVALVRPWVLAGQFTEAGVNRNLASAFVNSATTIALAIPGTSGRHAAPTTTTPFTWGTGDVVDAYGIYECP